ncbi:hypothetical protein PR048_026415 [Dryococelus australis]|uniref:Uncharacterized protein n=1 Tax=Dryococelus australis TaxID=614101 RepID=A0ABQ9GLC2_9NEOP|nr:hypothetical protein PR048_026415 [Dryococelus australis]
MEQRRNARAGGDGERRENPPTRGIFRGMVEGEQSTHYTPAAPGLLLVLYYSASSHPAGEPGSIPGGLAPGFSRVGTVADDAIGGFSRGSYVSPALAFLRCSTPRFTLIGSQDLDVESHPFTHSNPVHVDYDRRIGRSNGTWPEVSGDWPTAPVKRVLLPPYMAVLQATSAGHRTSRHSECHFSLGAHKNRSLALSGDGALDARGSVALIEVGKQLEEGGWWQLMVLSPLAKGTLQRPQVKRGKEQRKNAKAGDTRISPRKPTDQLARLRERPHRDSNPVRLGKRRALWPLSHRGPECITK